MSSRGSLTALRQGRRALRGIAAALGKMQVLIGCGLRKQLAMTVKVLKPFFVNLKPPNSFQAFLVRPLHKIIIRKLQEILDFNVVHLA